MKQLYGPTPRALLDISKDTFEPARSRAHWNEQVEKVWDNVSFLEVGACPDVSVLTGRPIPMRAVVNLAGLTPRDVRVEAVIGRVGVNGNLEETQVMSLPSVEQQGDVFVFLKEFVPHQTGRLGYKFLRSEEHTSELQSHLNLVCRLLLEKKKKHIHSQPRHSPAAGTVPSHPLSTAIERHQFPRDLHHNLDLCRIRRAPRALSLLQHRAVL